MNTDQRQAALFDVPQPLPHGLVYRPQFISPEEEARLLDAFGGLPFREARFREYYARRRVVHYHAEGSARSYEDGDAADGFSSGPLPSFLLDLRAKAAALAEVRPESFVHALVSEYRAGTPIGWHRDRPEYGIVVGISLAGWGRMRFRPRPPTASSRTDPRDIVVLDLEPRSGYVMQGAIRWDWQHSMLPTKGLRYSVTFRTAA
jgi:alkylated DNA repair dioxygenase AlkB